MKRQREAWEPMDWADAYLLSIRSGQNAGDLVLQMSDYLGEFEVTFSGVKRFEAFFQGSRGSGCEPTTPALVADGGDTTVTILGYPSFGSRETPPLLTITFQSAVSDRKL